MMSFVAKHWQECIWMLIGLSHGGAEYLALAALQLRQSVNNFCFCNRNSVVDHHCSKGQPGKHQVWETAVFLAAACH